MQFHDLLVLVHNALHAKSSEVTIPGTGRIFPISENPVSHVRSVIVPDVYGIRHEFMTQDTNENSSAGQLARLLVPITRERVLNEETPGLTNLGVINGHVTFQIYEAVERELYSRTLAGSPAR